MKSILNRILTKNDDDNVISGSVKSFSIKVISLILSFVLQVVLARVLYAEGYGVYSYIIISVNTAVLFSKLGMDQASKKIIPEMFSRSHEKHLTYYFSYIRRVVFCVSLGIGLVLFLFLVYLAETSGTGFVLGIGAILLLVFLTQLHISGGFLEGLQRFPAGLIPLHIIRPLLILSLVLILFFVNEISSTKAVYITVLCTVISFSTSSILLSRNSREKIKVTSEQKKKWINLGLPLMFSAGIHLLLTQTDVILLGIFKGSVEVGIYHSASKLSQLSLFGLTSINIVVAPIIAKKFAEKNLAELQKVISKASVLISILSFPVIVLLFIFNNIALEIFGTEFVVGSTALQILLIGQIFNAVAGSVGFLMTMTKYHKESLLILTIALVLNIILNVALIPKLGIEGAAISTAFSTIFWNLLMYLFVRIKLNIEPTIFGFLKR